MNPQFEPIAVLVGALGGEGGGVLAQWLVDSARNAGHAAQATSIPGVAQRTGATTYYLEFSPRPARELNGAAPVFSLSPVPGGVDVLVASELLECARQAGLGFVDAQRTRVLCSSARVLTTTEKMHAGDGRMDNARLQAALQAHSLELQMLDFSALAQEAGTIVSAVMLGALAGCGALPFARSAYETAIAAGGRGVAASLRGFALAFDRVQAMQALGRQVQAALAPAGTPADTAPALDASTAAAFPPVTHAMLAAGLARVRQFQDEAYAQQYLQRVRRVLGAESAAAQDAHFPITTEAARALAVWMAFDDIVRVADLKRRPDRWQRIQRELRLQPGQVLKLYDHFKPGVPEIASLLPAALANRLLRWDRQRQQRGWAPWALSLKLPTHSLAGWAALQLLASLRWLRRRGSRFAQEQAHIDAWLAAVEAGTREHPGLGLELALSARLVKGYGATHERGQQRLAHLLAHVARAPTDPSTRAQTLRAAREAAMADESGRALDRELHARGAPALAPREQPIRFMARRPKQAAGSAPDVRSSPPL